MATGVTVPVLAAKKKKPDRMPPQPGDQLALSSYDGDGRVVTTADLNVGAAPLLVYPRDPESGVIRERSRLNQILLLRFEADAVPETIVSFSANGVIAYSGVCTHTACGVSEWNAETRHLVCPCHGSTFDPLQKGKRISGPATRSLPILPITAADDHFVVAGAFSARVGPKK